MTLRSRDPLLPLARDPDTPEQKLHATPGRPTQTEIEGSGPIPPHLGHSRLSVERGAQRPLMAFPGQGWQAGWLQL